MMLSRTAIPLSKALPSATRLIVIHSSQINMVRSFHISALSNANSKASYATVAPESSSSKDVKVPPTTTPSKEDKVVAKVEGHPLAPDIVEKRDFHWDHPVYTKEEYDAIQVTPLQLL